jgi:DNA-binding NarL/FixJ family response regulator
MEAGRGWLLAADAYARAHDTAAALRMVEQARRIYQGSGAEALLAQVERLPRQWGVRATTTGAAAVELTRREAEIAALIAAGRSNAEIADHFVLSVRTVETHVSRIYAKLGVTTRGAAVSRLARLPVPR